MGRKLYVGNLAYQVGDADLEQLFAGFGIVENAKSSRIATRVGARALALWK